MEKAETFFTVTDCHCGCREDTKSSVPDGVTCISSMYMQYLVIGVIQLTVCTKCIESLDSRLHFEYLVVYSILNILCLLSIGTSVVYLCRNAVAISACLKY